MGTDVLRERGFFWWSTESVPAGSWAPPSAVSGVLTIGEDGRSTVELDSVLGPPHNIADQTLTGFLRTDQYVLLRDLRRHGGRLCSGGISYSGFIAAECLVGTRKLEEMFDALKAEKLIVDISEYAAWMDRNAISVKSSDSGIVVEFRKDPSIEYAMTDGKLVLDFSAQYPSDFPGLSKATVTEAVRLSFAPRNALSVRDARTKFGLLEDLLILLTDHNHRMRWPELLIRKHHYTYYFSRIGMDVKAPAHWRLSAVPFHTLKDDFGSLFETFCAKREQFGPGVYLYLGNRRGIQLYSEHRFASLVWGLESLHRTRSPYSEVPSKLQQKIHRILEQIDCSRDRKWLAGRLKTAAEPKLQERLFDLFSDLPINLSRKNLFAFCKQCADLRNDISHFGGHRDRAGDYSEFVRTLLRTSAALSHLYHALLLKEIGVPQKIMQWWFTDAHRSIDMQHDLAQVGLCPDDGTDSHDNHGEL